MNTNWLAVHTEDIVKANDMLKNLSDSYCLGISNVYLQTHGGGGDLLIHPKGCDNPDMTNTDPEYANNKYCLSLSVKLKK